MAGRALLVVLGALFLVHCGGPVNGGKPPNFSHTNTKGLPGGPINTGGGPNRNKTNGGTPTPTPTPAPDAPPADTTAPPTTASPSSSSI